MTPKRALLIVLDSVGIGHAPDAAAFGDQGADTVGHILERHPDTALPHLRTCGLDAARALAAGLTTPETRNLSPQWAYGALTEQSPGKDTTIGHWEIAGAPVDRPLATFDRFPESVVERLEQLTGQTFLGNIARSGTTILEELGAEHLSTGEPILYTSADSVMQIAAHTDRIPVDQLHEICRLARPLADELRIGRVIARPFTGEPGAFQRTADRRDFSLKPPPTILSALTDAGIPVISVGKIADIFAGQGISLSHPTHSNAEGMETIDRLWIESDLEDRLLIIANLVDFDMLYGHRRDPAGYARALEAFDIWLGDLIGLISDDDLVMITADHGNDPTWTGTDHTRERVPWLVHAPGLSGSLGVRDSFCDIAATLAAWFSLPAWPHGNPALT
ncbi:MAG: phosphopentomutase [Verrucomicrobiales bacterium]|nr:phosphopentomutase [Verrucomicrobiales bacterium]